ncbi:immunoglobulin-binding protein 1-like [Ascaphus truei]|uniref:immunoglobulin-binding protein 1-like n=1 Tax=Ascaphus truei TaxID=8439 RepID=UPI003F59121D
MGYGSRQGPVLRKPVGSGLRGEMAAAELPRLAELLENGWQLLEEVERSTEPSGARELQDKVTRGLGLLEQATRMVTQLDLFSRNEDLEEVSSADIRFLLLPALLGALTLRQVRPSHRLQHLEAARSYFVDFLRRCHEYKVSTFELPPAHGGASRGETEMEEGTACPVRPPAHPSLTSMAVQRQAKIERYKQKKELESRLSGLQGAVRSGTAEDEQVREFYLLQLQRWVSAALEEVESIDQELEIVRGREAMKQGAAVPHTSHRARPPMKPFILTRDALQAKVFGAGYPSLPTMTVDDWYEQHRKKGLLPDQGVPSGAAADEDQAASERERREEEDDADTVQRARNWDEWKDGHRRGYGNRHNMG